jgi:hypothetical protein
MIDELVPIEEAARVLGYKTTSGVRAAVLRGELVPAGRGARNRLFFTRESLAVFFERRARAFEPIVSRVRVPVSSSAGNAPIDERGARDEKAEDPPSRDRGPRRRLVSHSGEGDRPTG